MEQKEQPLDAVIWTQKVDGKTEILIDQLDQRVAPAIARELRKLGLEIKVEVVPCG